MPKYPSLGGLNSWPHLKHWRPGEISLNPKLTTANRSQSVAAIEAARAELAASGCCDRQVQYSGR